MRQALPHAQDGPDEITGTEEIIQDLANAQTISMRRLVMASQRFGFTEIIWFDIGIACWYVQSSFYKDSGL
jgi:histidinol-phosphate/aromatic aminotransferase/cobyric acid decarboxylase-like protein